MPAKDTSARDFYRAYYSALKGYTVKSVTLAEDDEFGDLWPTLTFTHPKKPDLKVEVSQDEEGNGPGFLFGLPIPS